MSYLVHRNQANLWPRTFTDNFLDDFFWSPAHAARQPQRLIHAPTDLLETDSAYTIRVDLPGVIKQDVEISVKNGLLTISGERKSDSVESEGSCSCSERRYGKFSRSFRLGDKVDAESIEATLEQGVLSVTLPKRPEATPKQIEIN